MAKAKRTGSGQPSPYKVYRVTSPGHQTRVVLASGMWSAVGVLLQWRAANDIEEVPFTIDPTWAASLTKVARQHIEDVCGRCTEPSIATCYRAGSGWTIVRATNERDEPD